ncbi:MAG: LysM peptidoglycan-binding domain-containing protein [Caldilinea sp. CFX5]|nr:LysM peptidoglycan-binding domain-containing protein [Caldilinea sp. CFX5]
MMAESLSNVNPEDIFAKAIERVEAGETVEAVLATAPEPLRAELREVLLLVSATHHLQRAPVPQPPAPRRTERKRAFLEAAATMKAASALPSTPVTTPVPAPTPKPHTVKTKAPWWAALADFWHDLQASFTAPNLRLAPLLTLIAVVYLAAFGFNRAASAATIGEPAYVVKQWMRDQKFNLSSEAQRPYVYVENVRELITDLAATTANLQNTIATAAKVAPKSTERIVFDGFAGDYLISGELRILMRYQPDLNTETYVDMAMPVTPGVGQFIEVTFQVVPSNDPNSGTPFILQGISAVVPDVQPAMAPTPEATTTPTAMPCQPYLPDGWIPYGVRAGDTLSAIAARTGTTVAQLQQANCLLDADVIPAGKSINAPKPPPTNTPTASVPTLAATLTAISPTVLTPSVGITPTATIVPSATATLAVTPPAITATVAPTVTTVITDPVNQTPTAVQTPPPPITVTLTATGEPTTDGTPTVTPVAPTAPVTGTVAPATGTPPAPTVTTTPPPELTTTATATSDAIATATPTAAAAETTPTAAATLTPIVADTPTPEPLPTATTPASGERENIPTATPPPPTSDPNQGGAGGGSEEPAPTNTPVPQSKSPLTGG